MNILRLTEEMLEKVHGGCVAPGVSRAESGSGDTCPFGESSNRNDAAKDRWFGKAGSPPADPGPPA